MSAAWNGLLTIDAGTNIIIETGANAQNHMLASFNGPMNVSNPPGPAGFPNLNILGAVTFSGSFIRADDGSGTFVVYASVTGAASVIGSRYFAFLNGIINSNGGGANYYPGNAVGTVVQGGQYN